MDYETVFNTLKRSIGVRKDIVLCAGKTNENTLVFLKKEGFTGHPDYKVEGITPQYFYFSNIGALLKQMHVTLDMMSKCMDVALSNFEYSTKPTPQDAFDLVYSKFKSMTEVQRVTSRGRVKAIPPKERTNEQDIFLKCYDDMTNKCKNEKQAEGTSATWNAYSPPTATKVPPLSELIHLDQVGSRYDADTKTYIKYTLTDLLENKDNVMFKYGIYILGGNKETTGYGKSSFARALASNLAQCIAEGNSLAKDDARVVEAKTFEGLKNIDFKLGDVIILDELKPADKESNVYVTESHLKAFNDVSAITTMRARNSDLVIPAGIPRITTGNALTRDEYFGDFDSKPLERKSITFFITKRLVTVKWAQSLKNVENETPEQVNVTNLLKGRVQAFQVESFSMDSSPDVGCFGLCPRRT